MDYNNETTVNGVRFQFISDGWRQILNSADVAALVDETGQGIAELAGEGFAYKPKRLNYGGGRVGGFVVAATREAREAQAEGKVLTRAVNGG